MTRNSRPAMAMAVWAIGAALAVAWSAHSSSSAAPEDVKAAPKAAGVGVFDAGATLELHLSLEAKEFEKLQPAGGGRFFGAESMAAQLAGERKGYVPVAGGPRGMPRPAQVMPPMLAEMLKLSDEQRRRVRSLQQDVDRRLDEILNEEQRQRFKAMREEQGPGGPGGGGPPRP